jgi:hypothetical protein
MLAVRVGITERQFRFPPVAKFRMGGSKGPKEVKSAM